MLCEFTAGIATGTEIMEFMVSVVCNVSIESETLWEKELVVAKFIIFAVWLLTFVYLMIYRNRKESEEK